MEGPLIRGGNWEPQHELGNQEERVIRLNDIIRITEYQESNQFVKLVSGIRFNTFLDWSSS
jgi:hypothetical protein